MVATPHLDDNDPQYPLLAAGILNRHERNEPEANITSAVREFLVRTRLVKTDEIVEENPPSDGSRRAVDLTALDTFIEFKRRIGTVAGGQPNPEYVKQIDDYLAQSQAQGRVRTGILTDGKYWLLRWPDAGPTKLTKPYFFVLENNDGWMPLYEWLRNEALEVIENEKVGRNTIADHFGPKSPNYQRDIDTLASLYRQSSQLATVRVKRQLWHDLLRTALGEIARSPDEMDNLFIRHTYLSAVIGMVVQASFGIPIRERAEIEPEDLLYGRFFQSATGLQGIVESDFFTWPAEVGGRALLQTLVRRVAKFDWLGAPTDIGSILYEAVIPPEERRQLGEYYTPDWLARTMVQELVNDPENQRVLDPACGSGTFVAEAVTHFLRATMPEGKLSQLHPRQVLDKLRHAVTGVDIHPVAVHLARAAWTLAAQPAIKATVESGYDASMSIPVYLGDSLQLRFRTGDLFAENSITIQVEDNQNTELVFPLTLVDRPEDFDRLLGHVAEAIESGENPLYALDDNGVTEAQERKTMQSTIATMQRLHDEGRDHLWAYYTRNMVRPVILSRNKVDVIVGNPPWINYNQTVDVLRDELRSLSRNRYDIWSGGRYATHQDVAGLFFARSVELYLKDNGVIGFVMPHSALQAGQYSRWRRGQWRAGNSGQSVHVNFEHKQAWDLEGLEPNNFFPIPASVVFASKCQPDTPGKPLLGLVERWRGPAGSQAMRRESAEITDTGMVGDSPYVNIARQGATIVPRCLFFVEEVENTAIVQAGQTVTVNPRRGGQDKAPWKKLDLTSITNQTIERDHLYDVHLGETIAPYVTLEPLQALLPVSRHEDELSLPYNDGGVGGIDLGELQQRMRRRWQMVSDIWEDKKAVANKLDILGQLDYLHKLSYQLNWGSETEKERLRIAYSGSGTPTAAMVDSDNTLIDYTLFWIPCQGLDEANYLLAIINSETLYEAMKPLMPKGQFGPRHVQKHLWKLPIPEFDPKQKLHVAIAKAGERAAAGAAQQLEAMKRRREEGRGEEVKVRNVRRMLRDWLKNSTEGKQVEAAVAALLGRGVDFRSTITIVPGMRSGQPCIRGMRMTVKDVMEYLAGGEEWVDFLDDFYYLTEADMYACLSFAAAERMDDDYSHLRNVTL
ncbi:MAG: DUF433 domain-containing protein [Chloroflexi bacterium]|nr:DUF433 domain-containing protein [Chloroflexota bacterium]